MNTAVSTADPPQDRAEPIQHAAGASGKKYLRKGKTSHRRERNELKKKVRNSPVSTNMRKEAGGGRRCSRAWSSGEIMVKQVLP